MSGNELNLIFLVFVAVSSYFVSEDETSDANFSSSLESLDIEDIHEIIVYGLMLWCVITIALGNADSMDSIADINKWIDQSAAIINKWIDRPCYEDGKTPLFEKGIPEKICDYIPAICIFVVKYLCVIK